MNLYRLDYQFSNGQESPVSDFMGARLFRSRRQADAVGHFEAQESGCRVKLTRIQGAGTVKVMGFFYPSSNFHRSEA